MGAVASLVRVGLLLAAAAVLGSLYGYPMQAMIVALLLIVLFWQTQMNRVQAWLNDPEGVPPDVYGIWGELTARIYLHQRNHKKVQKRLQANVEHLQDSLSSIRDGVVMVDDQSSIEWSNQAVLPLLGLRFPEDVGQTLTNLVREPVFNEYFLAGDYSKPLEFATIANADLHLRIEVTNFGQGERLLFVRDVSESVRMEQIRRDFVANVSHELRTPLTVVSGYLANFEDNLDSLPGPFVKPVLQMQQQAQRMQDLVKDLLWLSTIESEEHGLKREWVDVGDVVKGVVEELAPAHPDALFELSLEENVKIQGDYRELYSAVSNLVTNALKYGGHAGSVFVSWGANEGVATLSVKDNGPGIDEVHIPRLTQRFYRVDGSRATQTGGTGLGLAIVKHVVQSHDAQLRIDSTPGDGSTFSIVFSLGE